MNVNMTIDSALWALLKKEKEKGNPDYLETTEAHDIVSQVHDLLVIDSITMCNALIEKRLEQVLSYRQALNALLEKPQVEQRSQEWHDMRKNRLTASDTATAMGRGKFETRKNLLKKKAFPDLCPFISSYIMKWGTMFEEIANRSYRQRSGDMIVHEFGLVPHPSISYYGASPDGITELGVMLELKCPMKRRMDGTIPEQYEIQMQGQMAVCGLQECDYVECCLEDFEDPERYLAMTEPDSTKDHGIILEYNESGVMSYDYSPEYLTAAEAWIWAQGRIKNEKKHLAKITPWRLKEYFMQRVYFDAQRWENTLKEVSIFWKEVEEMRAAGPDGFIVEKQTRRRERVQKVIEFIDDETE